MKHSTSYSYSVRLASAFVIGALFSSSFAFTGTAGEEGKAGSNWLLNPASSTNRFIITTAEGAKEVVSSLKEEDVEAFLAASQASSATKPQPIPSGTNAETWVSYKDKLAEWYKQTVVANYRKFGRRNEKWDTELENYLLACVPILANQTRSDKILDSLTNKAAGISILGCDDPLLLYTRGLLLLNKESYAEAAESLQKSKNLLASSQYPLFYSFLTIKCLGESLQRSGNKAGSDALKEALYTSAAKAAADGDFSNGNQRFYCQECMYQDCMKPNRCTVLPDRFYSVALKECSISNRVDAWIAAIIQGEYHIAEAWKARGGGWASEVTEQGWKGFGNNLELARKNLSDAYESHPEFPESAARMVTVIMGNCSGADDERVWFDRAVAAQLDYTSAYMNLLLALKPRWGGSHKRMLGLARECLATKRFDTAVPSFYFLIAHEIGSEMDDWKEVYRQAGVYEDCVSATAGCIAAKTSSDEVRKFNSDMAIIAWATERYDDADRYLKEIGDSLHPKSLSAFGVSATEVAGKTRISVGPRGSEATDAETMAGRKQYDKAFAKYEAIAGDNSLDSATKSFAQGRMSDLRARSALERNDWVDLNYSQDMVGWQQKDGKWCMQTNGMLVGWREGTGWLRLVWDIQPGVNVEFTCDAEFGRGTTAEGVTILLAYGGTVPTCGVGLRFRQGQLFLYNNQKNQKVQFPCRFTSVNSLHVLLWDKKLTVSVNGIEVTNKYAIKEDWIGGDGLAFAEYYEGAGRHEVRIKNARIRRLKEDPEGF